MTKQEYMDMYEAIGVAMDVHKILGRGLAEPIYQEAYAIEMRLRGLDVEREKQLKLLNYLRIAKKERGILFNFGETNLHTERYLYLPAEDRFVLLTHYNYKLYITD